MGQWTKKWSRVFLFLFLLGGAASIAGWHVHLSTQGPVLVLSDAANANQVDHAKLPGGEMTLLEFFFQQIVSSKLVQLALLLVFFAALLFFTTFDFLLRFHFVLHRKLSLPRLPLVPRYIFFLLPTLVVSEPPPVRA